MKSIVVSFGWFILVSFISILPSLAADTTEDPFHARMKIVNSYFNQGKWQQALDEIKTIEKSYATQDHPDKMNIHLLGIQIAWRLQNSDEVQAFLAKAGVLHQDRLKACKDTTCRAHQLMRTARVHQAAREFESALKLLQEAKNLTDLSDGIRGLISYEIQDLAPKVEAQKRDKEIAIRQAEIEADKKVEADLRNFYRWPELPSKVSTEKFPAGAFIGLVSEGGFVLPRLTYPLMETITVGEDTRIQGYSCQGFQAPQRIAKVEPVPRKDQSMCDKVLAFPLVSAPFKPQDLVFCTKGQQLIKSQKAGQVHDPLLKSHIEQERPGLLHPSFRKKGLAPIRSRITLMGEEGEARLYFVKESLQGQFCQTSSDDPVSTSELAYVLRMDKDKKVRTLMSNAHLYCGGEQSYGSTIEFEGILPGSGQEPLILFKHFGYESIRICAYVLTADKLQLLSCDEAQGC